nr:hypothetical protein [Tanacetum cinerariifolium]
QLMEVDAPPDIIDVSDEDDDIIDDEDALPYDLAESGDEDLVKVDDDVDVARSHGSNGGCKSKRKPNLGGRAAGRLHTRDKTRNLWLKEITDKNGPVPIRFETQFDLRPHMESPDWTDIDVGIQQHLQKAYNTNKSAFKAQHWVIDPETGTYNVEKIRRARPEGSTAEEQSSATQEYPSLIDTFFVAHTVNGVFTRDEDRRIYRLRAPTLMMRSIAWLEGVSSDGTFSVSVEYCQHGSQPAQVGPRLKARSPTQKGGLHDEAF